MPTRDMVTLMERGKMAADDIARMRDILANIADSVSGINQSMMAMSMLQELLMLLQIASRTTREQERITEIRDILWGELPHDEASSPGEGS